MGWILVFSLPSFFWKLYEQPKNLIIAGSYRLIWNQFIIPFVDLKSDSALLSNESQNIVKIVFTTNTVQCNTYPPSFPQCCTFCTYWGKERHSRLRLRLRIVKVALSFFLDTQTPKVRDFLKNLKNVDRCFMLQKVYTQESFNSILRVPAFFTF